MSAFSSTKSKEKRNEKGESASAFTNELDSTALTHNVDAKSELMILVLGSHTRKLHDNVDSSLLQNVLRSHSTPFQNARRGHRSRRKDYILPCLDRLNLSDGRRLLRVKRDLSERVGAVLDSDGAGRGGLVEEDSDGFLLAEDVEVSLGLDHGMDVAVGGVAAVAGLGVDPLRNERREGQREL